MAAGAKAGEKLQASELELPAATTTVMPLATAVSIAALYAWVFPEPPRLALQIAGLLPLVATQSRLFRIHEV